MKKLSALLVMAFGMAIAPMAIAPTAQGAVCALEGGERHYVAGECIDTAESTGYVPIMSQHTPYFFGETPCYTVEGVAYYTPGGHPC